MHSHKNCNHCERSHDENNKLEIIKIIISILLAIVGILNIFSDKISWYIFILAYVISGYKVILNSIKNILKGEIFDENFLMSIATIGALLIREPLEAVAVMIFYNIGELFQEIAVGKSKKSIIELMNIKPKTANLKIDGNIKIINPEEVKINDIIVIKTGEKIPVDGVIINGTSQVNTSALTGESMLREVNIGDKVLAGFINEGAVLQVRVEKEFKDTVINEIINLVKNSNNLKSKTEKFISKFAKIYTPIVVIFAVMIIIVPLIMFGITNINEWINRALVFLVTSCPCALVVSIPLGYFAGIGKASKDGLLIKGSNYLDLLTKANAIVLDKTGTITKGKFEVTKINMEKNVIPELLYETAVIAECMSNHPIARSILEKLKINIDDKKIENYNELAGLGIMVEYCGEQILAGNEKLLRKENIEFNNINEIGTIIYFARNGKYIGNIIIEDAIKEDSKEAIENLKNLGIEELYILTGDNSKVANKVANEVEIKNVYSNLLPHEKVEKLQQIKEKNKITVAIGDGINDSPILALADIGVAIGKGGADLAIETADMVIMDGKLSSFEKAIKTANRTKKIVMENIYIAIIIKLIILILGALGLSSMWEAVFADVGVTLITILNSLRIFK